MSLLYVDDDGRRFMNCTPLSPATWKAPFEGYLQVSRQLKERYTDVKKHSI